MIKLVEFPKRSRKVLDLFYIRYYLHHGQPIRPFRLSPPYFNNHPQRITKILFEALRTNVAMAYGHARFLNALNIQDLDEVIFSQ